ncbi:MAG: MMPL family transporter [Planctomycetia bacterium]|nr:MMPL family transporter [Planctomycetia bacterium]
MYARIAEYLIRRRWAILTLLAVATLAAAVVAPRIRFDFTPQAVFSDHDGSVEYCEKFKETFGHNDSVLLVLVEAQGPRDVLDREVLAWQAKTAEDLATVESVRRVSSVATLKVARIVIRRPWVVPVPLISQWPLDAEGEARVRASLDRFDLVTGSLISEDRRAAAILVYLDPDVQDIDAVQEVVKAIRGRLDAHAPPPGYRLHLCGFPAIRVDIVQQLRADLAFLIPVAGLVLLAALAITYRCVSGTLVPLVAVGAGSAWTAAVLVLFGQTLSIISSILPVMMLTIGMSNCVHVVSYYAEQCDVLSGQRIEAIKRSTTHLLSACLLTYLTTAVGFGSLVATRSEVLFAFGWQASLGMVFLYISTIAVPAVMLPWFRPPRYNRETSGSLSPATRFAAIAGYLVTRHPRSVLFGGGMIVAASLWVGSGVVINSYMMESFDDQNPTIQSMRLLEEKLGGFITLDESLTADRPGRFLEPEIFDRVQQAQRFAAGRPGVLSARSYVDLHERFREVPGRRGNSATPSPSSEDKASSGLLRSEQILRSLGDVVEYDTFLSADGRRARIMLRTNDLGTRQALALIDDLERDLAERFPAGGPIEACLTGDAYIHAKSIDGFIRAMLSSLLCASVIIFTLIAMLFRSVKLGLISIAPNLTPLVVTLGYMGLRGYELNITHVMVFSISLGIAVDGTIHFLARFRQERTRTADSAEAIRRSYRGAGRAMVLSSSVILCGLAVLLLSDFVPTRRFAELGAVTMAASLLGNLLLLPASLMFYQRRSETKTPTP